MLATGLLPLVALALAPTPAPADQDLTARGGRPPVAVDASSQIVFDFDWRKPLVRMGMDRTVNVTFGQPALVREHHVWVIGTGEGNVLGLSSKDGSVRWRHAHGEPFEGAVTVVHAVSPAGVSQPLAVVGSQDGTLLALNPDNGTLVWRADVEGDVRAPGTLADGKLVIATARNQLLALDPQDGRVLWSVGRPVPNGLTVVGHAKPLVAGTTVYMTFSDGYAEAYDLRDGARRWSRPLSLKGGEFIDADADPQLAGNLLFVASYSDGVYALNPQDGQPVWSRTASGVRSLALVGDKVLAGTGEGYVVALSQADGRTSFRTQLEAGFVTRMLVQDELVLFGGGQSGLVVLDGRSGRPLQATGYQTRMHGDPYLEDEHVALVSADGYLYAFRKTVQGRRR